MAVLAAAVAWRDSYRRGWGRFFGRLTGIVLGLLLVIPAAAQSVALRDYQIKAVFLFNFAQFVDWPPAAFQAGDSPFVIGVLGDDPFGPDLEEATKGEKLGNRVLEIRRYRRVEDVDACHILFISRSEISRLERVMTALGRRSILTVSDTEEFNRRGGMIRFVTENNKVRMKINLEAAKSANLVLSSKLLRAADIVPPDRN